MSDNTDIEWCDATWNPVTGCTEVSPGCDHCYAKTFAERWRGTEGHYFENGFDVQLRPDKLDQPLRWKKPRKIFVNSMSDLFHDQVPDEYIADVFAVMACAPDHTFQLLTKRHARMRSLLNGDFRDQVAEQITELLGRLPSDRFKLRGARIKVDRKADDGLNIWGPSVWPLPNVWLGVSTENQQWADIRIPALLDTPAAVRFISAEPLLGPIDLRQSLRLWTPPADAAWESVVPPFTPGLGSVGDGRMVTARLHARDVLHWVIAGGESGHGARPMHPDWARSLRDQCQAAGVAFHFKQWGEWSPDLSRNQPVANGRRLRYERRGLLLDGSTAPAFVPCTFVDRVAKKAAGRELDGRTWDEYPQTREVTA